ncbi:MAG: helix-turn-helix domain-containing protein [Candidatus Eiseniibacteriota bacterium]
MSANSHIELGRKIKQERLRRSLTLKDIEAKVGISATHLSEVERGKSSPTVGVLEKIARALGTRSALLIDAAAGLPVSHTRPGERRVVLNQNGTVRTESLSDSFPGSEVSILLKTYQPGSGQQLEPRGHEGEEFVHILGGRLRVVVGDEEFVLEPGDSLHFKSTRPHAFENVGDGECSVFMATCPRFGL